MDTIVTFKIGTLITQIDYFLVRRKNLKQFNVLPGDNLVSRYTSVENSATPGYGSSLSNKATKIKKNDQSVNEYWNEMARR